MRHPALTHGPPSTPTKYRIGIDYVAEWTSRDRSGKPVDLHDMRFSLDDLGGFQAIKRWLPVAAKYEAQLSQVMATIYRQPLVTDSLLNRVAAVEAWHKELTQKPKGMNLVARLSDAAHRVGTPFTDLIGGKVDEWSSLVKRERVKVAHGLGQGGFEGVDTLYLADSVYWLFITSLLHEPPAPPPLLLKMQAHGEYRHLRRQLMSVLT